MSHKKTFNLIAGTVAGGALGFIHNNTKGLITGSILGYNLANQRNKLY